MAVNWITTLITFKGMRMDNCDTIYNMRMIEKSNAPKKTEKEQKKKVLRNINTPPF